MPRKKANIHYLYKTTCLVTGRYYIGMHSTSNLEDGYMGSGKRLRYSIRKYGVENHTKEILEFFDSRELLVEAEKTAITTDMLCDAMCMNIMSGGTGGFTIKQQKLNSLKAHQKLKFLRENNPEWVKTISKIRSEAIKKAYNTGAKEKKYFYNWNGKKHSDKTKKLIAEKKLGNNIGASNSQYGTMWITNGTQNRKIKKEDIIPDGWYKGRV